MYFMACHSLSSLVLNILFFNGSSRYSRFGEFVSVPDNMLAEGVVSQL